MTRVGWYLDTVIYSALALAAVVGTWRARRRLRAQDQKDAATITARSQRLRAGWDRNRETHVYDFDQVVAAKRRAAGVEATRQKTAAARSLPQSPRPKVERFEQRRTRT